MAKNRNFDLKALRNPTEDEKIWGIALAIACPESGNLVPSELQEWEPVLSLTMADYAIKIGNGECYVQVGTDLSVYKFPNHCPELPEELREFCEEFVEFPRRTCPIEDWEIFVNLIEELSEDDLERMEEIIAEL